MVTRKLISRLFDAAYMQRWNDQIRPVELTELDKQAHKMVVAFVLGKYEERSPQWSWTALIESGMFEYLQRLVLTDLKPQVFYKIKEDPVRYHELNDWVYSELEELIAPLGQPFCNRFREYLSTTDEPAHQRVVKAAHFFATKWEFDIIRKANPLGYEMERISNRLEHQQEHYYDLVGLRNLELYPKLRSFVDLCGLLRFQLRWSHVHRVPKTSVLGHMLIVAMISYLFSLQIGACENRCTNNYFTGLFHDLPEALTRDIISPVKHSVKGISALIKTYEREEMQEKVYPLLPEAWHPQLQLYTEDEFRSVVTLEGQTQYCSSDVITERFNDDSYNPRDGEMIKAIDDFAAYMEAQLALDNGIASPELDRARESIHARYESATIAGIDFGRLYAAE